MKVFVDTNVWLSGFMGHGLCADLLAAWVAAETVLVLDERVRLEFLRIAEMKFGASAQRLDYADAFFAQACVVAPAAKEPVPGIPDPDDAWIIAAALTVRADAFVTGDKALLALGRIEAMPIIDPRTAYLRLRGLA